MQELAVRVQATVICYPLYRYIKNLFVRCSLVVSCSPRSHLATVASADQPRTQRGSLLGLDKRAAQQRAAKQQGNAEGGTPRHGGLSFTPQDEQDDDDDADMGSGGNGTGRDELGGDGFVKPAAPKAAKDKGQESR